MTWLDICLARVVLFDGPMSVLHLGSAAKRLPPQVIAVQAGLEPADALFWQLVGKPVLPSPIALWGAKPTETQSSSHPNCNRSLYGSYTHVQDQAAGPIVGWDGDLRGQRCDGGVSVPHSILEPTSSRASKQHFSTHVDPDDSHSQSMPNMPVQSLKRARAPHGPAGCFLKLRSSSLSESSVPNQSSTPWRKCMRRGFLLSAAAGCSEDDGSPSAVHAPVEAQVCFPSHKAAQPDVEPATHEIIHCLH